MAGPDPVHAAEPTMLQANVYLSHGQLAQALAAFKEVLRLSPRSTAALLGLSKLYAVTGQTKEEIGRSHV